VSTATINLALQGGGAHGAFTWGALDRMLEDPSIDIEGISATSAGAMNAVALKQGWVQDGRDGARARLEAFWLRVSGLDGILGDAVMDWLRLVSPSPAVTARLLEFSPAVVAADAITRVFSPYQFNPANYHPLRGLVDEMLDGDVASAIGPKLFITATNVRDGKPRVFMGAEITTDAVLASACLVL
jgi:NTE family protein